MTGFLLATDGFTRVDAAAGCPPTRDVLANHLPLAHAAARLRCWETRHRTSPDFPHLTAHDDITAARFTGRRR